MKIKSNKTQKSTSNKDDIAMEGSSKTWLALAKGYNTKRSKIIIMTLPRSFFAIAYKFAMLLIVAFLIFYSAGFALLVLSYY